MGKSTTKEQSEASVRCICSHFAHTFLPNASHQTQQPIYLYIIGYTVFICTPAPPLRKGGRGDSGNLTVGELHNNSGEVTWSIIAKLYAVIAVPLDYDQPI